MFPLCVAGVNMVLSLTGREQFSAEKQTLGKTFSKSHKKADS